jgi:hypothetical protein
MSAMSVEAHAHQPNRLRRVGRAIEKLGVALRGGPDPAERGAAGPVDLASYFPVALIHPPINPPLAPIVMLDPDLLDARSHEAAARVVDAYHAAMQVSQAASPSMWAAIEAQHAEFFIAVRARDLTTVQQTLARLFHTSLIWGLGRVHPQTPVHIREGQPQGVQIQVTDALVSLAEATGVSRITSIEQEGIERHLAALQGDIDALLAALIERTGLDVDMPDAGANYGCRIAGRRVSIDTLVHAYTAYRLRQLGIEANERIVEIGGGYGCLAFVCRRNGYADYTIVDLPWVNLIQGYLLIMSLPPESVSLFGEADRPVKVRPFWEFAGLADRSVDVVINTDSLPEIGAETGRRYIADIARVTRRCFLSINQEATTEYPGVGRQLHVNALCGEEPRLRLLHRHRYWMRQGYVEELFAPAGAGSR